MKVAPLFRLTKKKTTMDKLKPKDLFMIKKRIHGEYVWLIYQVGKKAKPVNTPENGKDSYTIKCEYVFHRENL